MKRFLAMALAVMMVLSFAACGGEKVKESDVPTLVWYVQGDKQHDVATVMEEVNKITVPAIGAKLDLQFIDDASYSEKMQMMMAAGTEFDICFTGYVNSYRNGAEKGGFVALNDYLKDMPEFWESIPEHTWGTTKIKGNIYAVPNLQIIGEQWNFYTFKDLAEKYGLLDKVDEYAPINLDVMEEYLGNIKKNEPSYYPIRYLQGATSFSTLDTIEKYKVDGYAENIVGGVVHAYFDKDGKLETFDTATNREGYKWQIAKAREWFEKGFIREDILSATDDTAEHAAGKYASWVEKWKPGIIQELEQKYQREVVSFQITPTIYRSAAPDAMTAISKTSKHPDLAIKMVELVNTNKDVYNLICFGVEGKHYNLDKDGRVVYNDEGGYIPKACWKFGNQFNALLLPGQPDDVWELTRKINEDALPSPLVGFIFDTTPVTTEISAVLSVQSEYAPIMKGVKADYEGYLKEYDTKLKQAGVDRIIKEIERQYTEWEKNNK